MTDTRKNSVQKFIIYLSLAVFVVANVGLAVYTHTCSIAGIEKSLFLGYEDPCGDDHPVKKKACCSEDESEEEHIENSCCSTDTDYVALDIDTRIDASDNKIVSLFVPTAVFSHPMVYFAPEITENRYQKLAHSNLPPPKYQGRNLQSIHQVYRI